MGMSDCMQMASSIFLAAVGVTVTAADGHPHLCCMRARVCMYHLKPGRIYFRFEARY